MSLSVTCLKQHAKEDALAKKWLLRGLLIAAGAHLGLIPLMAAIPPEVVNPPERIALVVTGPTDPLETPVDSIEELPPEESVEALTEAITQAELAAVAQASGGATAPAPPPIASFQPAPPPVPDSPATLAEPDLSEPEPAAEAPEVPEIPKPETDESSPTAPTEDSEGTADEPALEPDVSEVEQTESERTEADSAPVETAANSTSDEAAADLEALRERLSRARARENGREGAENSDATGDGDASANDGSATETARRSGPSEGSGSGTADGDGDGDRSGSNTVSCRRCDRPSYPEEALAEGVEGSPSVNLEYDENGNVIGAILEQTSGNAALDQAALEAARNYQLDSGGRSGSVSVEIDFGIEGSERSRAARQRGERESVTTPVPDREVVREAAPERTPAASEATTNPASVDNPPAGPEEPASIPPLEPAPSPAPEPAPSPAPEPAPLPAPEPAPSSAPESAPPPLAPEPVPIPDSASPPEPAPSAPVPDIGPAE